MWHHTRTPPCVYVRPRRHEHTRAHTHTRRRFYADAAAVWEIYMRINLQFIANLRNHRWFIAVCGFGGDTRFFAVPLLRGPERVVLRKFRCRAGIFLNTKSCFNTITKLLWIGQDFGYIKMENFIKTSVKHLVDLGTLKKLC